MNKIFFILIVTTFLYASDINKNMFTLGETLYQETCISCHGVDGKANNDLKFIVKPRNLNLTLLNEEQTYKITKDGAHYWGAKADIMPAFKYIYTEEQLRAIAHYITHKFNPNLKNRIDELCSLCEKIPDKQNAKMKKWGKKIYNRNCLYCHGPKGKGDGVATKNPVDSIFPYNLTKTLLTKKQMFLYVKYGGKHFGTNKDDMPSWKVKYNDFKIHSVVKYVDEIIRK